MPSSDHKMDSRDLSAMPARWVIRYGKSDMLCFLNKFTQQIETLSDSFRNFSGRSTITSISIHQIVKQLFEIDYSIQ
ncbi:MAG: hypothetical protein GX267_17375 [Fibrobacter sp.]|nr:hypothetical protein [Fibrobacter sp.]